MSDLLTTNVINDLVKEDISWFQQVTSTPEIKAWRITLVQIIWNYLPWSRGVGQFSVSSFPAAFAVNPPSLGFNPSYYSLTVYLINKNIQVPPTNRRQFSILIIKEITYL